MAERPIQNEIEHLAEQLRTHRDLAGLTQLQMAEKLYVSPASIGRFERGIRIPPADVLIGYAVILNIPITKLFSPRLLISKNTLYDNGFDQLSPQNQRVVCETTNMLIHQLLIQQNGDP